MSGPRISVVISAYTEDRWIDLVVAVDSVRRQTIPVHEIIVIVDHNPALLSRVEVNLPDVIAAENTHQRGLSGARNCGIQTASGDVIAFLDDDAVAETHWLEHLCKGYLNPHVLGVGGSIEPSWDDGRPSWFPIEFDWVVGCSYRGITRTTAPVRNLIGCNMSFRREVFDKVGGFRTGIGRVGTLPVGCEETELCLRALRHFPKGVMLYEPAARVAHRVPENRARWAYFRSRCFAEGKSKAMVSQLAGVRDGLASERAYTLNTLPHGAAQGLLDVAKRGDLAGFGRAGAIIAGLFITTAGYVFGRTSTLLRTSSSNAEDVWFPTNHMSALPIAHSDEGNLRMKKSWIEFNIYDKVRIRVDRDAPTAPYLLEMFQPFLTEGLEDYDLTITGELEPMPGASYGETEYEYTDSGVIINATNVQILHRADGFHLNGTCELLVSALPLIDYLLVKRRASMIHALTVDYDGVGVCLPAWGGVGKTSTMAKLLKIDDVSFMGDDWAFLTQSGDLLGYAKPMFIKPHHRPFYPHLFASKRKPLVPLAFSRPLGRLTTIVHPLVTKYPRLARVSRQLTPEHIMVTPQQAFPNATVSTNAPLGLVMFVERFNGQQTMLQEQNADWMVSRLIGNFHAELPSHSREVMVALGATGLIPGEQAVQEKAYVLSQAIQNKPTFLLKVPESMSPDQASDEIVKHVQEVLIRTGIRQPDEAQALVAD